MFIIDKIMAMSVGKLLALGGVLAAVGFGIYKYKIKKS